MKYRKLGESGLIVSEMALGTMVFGEEGSRGTTEAEAASMIARYLEAGGNHLDTADVYADGRSEEIVGRAIKARRPKIVLATKLHFSTGEGPNDQGLSRRHIMQAAEASLRRLQTDYIDLLYMHCWDPLTPLEESLRALDDLVRAGKVRYLGISNFKAWQVMKAVSTNQQHGWTGIVAAQYQYSLVKRDIEYEFMDLVEEVGLGLVPWGALGGGFLSGKYSSDKKPSLPEEGRLAVMPDDTEESWSRRDREQNWEILAKLEEIAQIKNATPAQVALRWVLQQPCVSSLLIGARTREQLDQNLGACDFSLSDDEWDVLEQCSQLPELYPYRFLKNYTRTIE